MRQKAAVLDVRQPAPGCVSVELPVAQLHGEDASVVVWLRFSQPPLTVFWRGTMTDSSGVGADDVRGVLPWLN
jgi:hypothetical protein